MQDSNASPDPLHRFRLDGRTAVITGATGILGARFSHAFAAAGANVAIADLDQEKCAVLANAINAATGREAAHAFAVDLADEKSVGEWSAAILARLPDVDILLNNAAAKSPNFFKAIEEFDLPDWNQVMAVNVTGMFLVVRAFGSHLIGRGRGTILNIASIYGIVGPDQRIYDGSFYPDLGGAINTPLVYSVSKGAVVALTRHLATTWGHHGIRTNSLSPGGVFSGQNETFERAYSNRVPLGRMGAAPEMVDAALYLCSDAAAYINGHNLVVDGGLTAW
jgi:NAD(P)-dependent dehydrogenase (short-subunit alcohol dehydrogenase family)